MQHIRVGGVPEHFNLAWHLAIESGAFAREGIYIDWVDVPGGTGAMCSALRQNKLDIAVALTEGMISDIMNSNPSKIVQFYVNSPLVWGVFVNAQSGINSVAQAAGKRFAISRPNSGSHLMSFVYANKNGFTINENNFVVVNHLDGARKALMQGDADVFMWEKFTTKPLVDAGEFRMIDECRTPWPCFVVAARDEFIAQHEVLLNRMLSVINLSCLLLQNNSEAPGLIANRYGIKQTDALLWFKELEFACHPEMQESELNKIVGELFKLGIIRRIPKAEEICYAKNLEMMI